ncbi:hypothetical protein JXR93_09730 [bacterium]|nr:hypothetical protein [bacterium]
MRKLSMIIFFATVLTSCYGKSDDVYSKNFKNSYNSEIFEVDAIYNSVARVISKDGKIEKEIILSKKYKNIKEGDIVVINGETIIKQNSDKLKHDIERVQQQLQNRENFVAINNI